MNGRQETEDKQFKFLRYLYEHEGETKLNWFESLEVGGFLGYTDDETEQVVRYLLKTGSVEHRGGSGKQILISLTRQGRGEARTGSLGSGTPEDTAGIQVPHSNAESSDARSLTPSQKKDYDSCGFKCHDKIHITGEFGRRITNVVEVNGQPLTMGDRPLELFLRLVIASKASQGGWLDADELSDFGIDPSDHKYQPLMRLQDKLGPGLLDNNPKELIEGGYNRKRERRYRLSTHPDFVTYNKGRLLKHTNDDVKRLAAELP